MKVSHEQAGVIAGAYPLHKVATGRFFTRIVGGGEMVLAGIVALPKRTPAEVQVLARVNENLYVDLANFVSPSESMPFPEDLNECGVDSLLTCLRYRQHVLGDTLDLFLRETHLESDALSQGSKWMMVAGVSKKPIPLAGPMGLYELRESGLVYLNVPSSVYNGSTISCVMRDCLWGPGGGFGLATSMPPSYYDKWIEKERVTNARRDPTYARFIEIMKEDGAGTTPTVYTESQKGQLEATSLKVLKRVLAEEEAQRDRTYAQCSSEPGDSTVSQHQTTRPPQASRLRP
ncbi:hypothetical protein [Hydrogenophaga sp. 2FB]|uniref:hypothetical protein n=1 Tax=Hydrogenophaga sp. 2FB TaxID=2502187 RepID=UPI0010F5CF79|nr:hypothetical protein [Hydrogenophaga sp. 2FB]